MKTHAYHIQRSWCARSLLVLAQVTILYAGTVFAGGMLIDTDCPVAIRTGLILHKLTMIDSAIRWADARGHDMLTHTLLALAEGPRARRTT